ncbi:MAG: hypothetical protein HQK75_18525 [Candidatus Magnetomorum sp.]|nr:hypothetical protein [Candidatus Magnetomorum sp.]
MKHCQTFEFVVFLLLIIVILNGCINIDRPAISRNGIWYGVTEQKFRFRFWNYYKRGLSFEDFGIQAFYDNDLLVAIQLLSCGGNGKWVEMGSHLDYCT